LIHVKKANIFLQTNIKNNENIFILNKHKKNIGHRFVIATYKNINTFKKNMG